MRAPALHWCVALIMVVVIEVCLTVWKLRDTSRRISVLWRLASVSVAGSGAISVFHSLIVWLCAVSTSCCLWWVCLCR
jgi:3-dehydroquinate dehydratase